MTTGVYQIRNLLNNKRYIGHTARLTGFKERWSEHQRELLSKRHKNLHLQRAWDKNGASAFVFEILEKCSPMDCVDREQHYLDTLLFASCHDARFRQLGYNIRRIGESNLGVKFSQQTCKRMSASKCGNRNPSAKLTTEQVLQIQELLHDGVGQKAIGLRFSVTQQTVSNIKTGRKWKGSNNELENSSRAGSVSSCH